MGERLAARGFLPILVHGLFVRLRVSGHFESNRDSLLEI